MGNNRISTLIGFLILVFIGCVALVTHNKFSDRPELSAKYIGCHWQTNSSTGNPELCAVIYFSNKTDYVLTPLEWRSSYMEFLIGRDIHRETMNFLFNGNPPRVSQGLDIAFFIPIEGVIKTNRMWRVSIAMTRNDLRQTVGQWVQKLPIVFHRVIPTSLLEPKPRVEYIQSRWIYSEWTRRPTVPPPDGR
ncbi:MAG: hypothetical protein HZA89_15790 [Verrucomicrobia bacterium]|nr:hypothetical protein [Verrucomicrobiota bacterium]